MAHLLDPITFPCGAVAPNRLMLAPLTNQQSHADGTLSEDERRWLVRRAAGGFGITPTCASHVLAAGQGFDGQLGCWGDHQLPGLTRLAADLRATGTLSLVQIFHGGVRSPRRLTGVQPVSASSFDEGKPGFEVPRAASEEEIAGFIDAFRDAALRAERAGFAGVEVHGAHGYLLSQFLSATMNTRADGWGGSPEGRARLIREVVRQIRAATAPGFVVGVRLSLEPMGQAAGLDLDESLQVAAWLADDGADFIHASLWDASRNTQKRPDAHPLPLLRAAVPAHVPLVAAGKLWTRDEAQAVLDLGADVACIGRAAIVDPDWPDRVVRRGEAPLRAPAAPADLLARDVSPAFVSYLRRFPGLVAETGRGVETVSFPSAIPGRIVTGVLALPVEPTGPAVLVCHEYWGINDDIRRLTERLAAAGFVALAVDLYQGQSTTDPSVAAGLSQQLDTLTACEDLAGAVAFLRARADVVGGVGVTGFCLGGAMALAAAARTPGIAAAAPFYGLPRTDKVDLTSVAIPVQGHFAARDAWVSPERVDAAWALLPARPDVERFTYAADHAFMRASDPGVYDAKAAELAWGRLIAFFRRHLSTELSTKG